MLRLLAVSCGVERFSVVAAAVSHTSAARNPPQHSNSFTLSSGYIPEVESKLGMRTERMVFKLAVTCMLP